MLIKIALFIVIVISFTSFSAFALSESEISAEASVVMDAESFTVLFEKNADKKLSMASTTKIMTSLLAVESGKMNMPVTASHDVDAEGTSIGISEGDCMTLETLVYALLLESGNDAALLTAEYLAGSENEFARMMNDKADMLGMTNTNFVTASGLDSEKHYSTAYDMALLASNAIRNHVFKSICRKQTYKAEYITPDFTDNYSNHNKLLKLYDGVFGIKTGFTRKSGRCLVSACSRDGRTLVISTLNAPDDWNDHIKLYDYCFKSSCFSVMDFKIPERLKVIGGIGSEVRPALCKADKIGTEGVTGYSVLLPEFIYAPVKKGDTIGKIILYTEDRSVCEYAITSQDNIPCLSGTNKPEKGIYIKIRYLIKKLLRGCL